jgi:hypothetical protein
MMIVFIIEMMILLIGIYYLTIFLHLMGVPLFKAKKVANKTTDVNATKANKKEKYQISVGKALIPFYYWFTRETTI